MIRDITIGQYFFGKSFIHKMDARMKILISLFFIILIFLCKNFFSLGLVAAFTVFILSISKIPFKLILKSLKPIIIIVVFTAFLNLFYTKGGKTLYEFWVFEITLKGVYSAIFMAVRIICLVAGTSLLTYTTTPTSLTNAIESLLSPLKRLHVDVHTFAMMMTLALRFIPTLIEEIDRIMSAQKARGADLESGGLVKRARALIPIFIPLFVSAFRRAYELAYAMECRCYNGGKGRTSMKKMHFTYRDGVAFAVIALLTAGIFILNFNIRAVI
ncbi:MAG: energy-coupling factor transporter transmembrane protein EcfT [Clostridiales bacterium]|nr:energy-coupling factor transporter transmembrane protein EcfT [Clostridiales bacterium]